MKKIYIVFLFFILSCMPSLAINWEKAKTPHDRVVYLDLDSISENEDYYFYNIKFKYENADNFIIITMQSQKSHPFSARIKSYTESEYEAKNGDYENIFQNMTDKMEPVTYESIVYACYKRVKQLKTPRNNIMIIN